ncbi:M17 family metallopeptidase [Mycoplasma tauri]|uniref:M17 family metallopeptidase n=1 Tax=Mycoplasma tauri TaxID=547987 RepID=UPI001CC14748|nr:leucyl aminopeptidase family protein [Mycoplasma tauri]MBZ4203518.1 leucyl aminopeptidase family protein [Mycoplasma tauri]
MSNYYQIERDDKILLKAQYEDSPKSHIYTNISKKSGAITEFLSDNEAYIFLDKKVKNYYHLVDIIDKKILTSEREYQIDIESFVREEITLEEVTKAFYSRIIFHNATLFNIKKENKPKNNYTFLFKDKSLEKYANKLEIIGENRNLCRNYQVMPENYCNSVELANFVKKDFANLPDVKITILDKNKIKELGMNLILAVNRGSTHEPRVVIIEYNGNPTSNEKTTFVGKGITFDTGGVNTKGYHMEGMKYDMSGSVIVAYALKSLAELKVKKNVAAIMCITDNRLDGDAVLPQNVYKSMSGISVEITDTDAEGRLVLADGLYYGATVLKSTTLIDMATLTGSVVRALGKTYSGIWATNDEKWTRFKNAAIRAKEKVWRLPFHEDFHEPNQASITADLNNYNEKELSDSNTAAMFLKEFTNNVDYIHCDIAGTADIDNKPMGVLVETLVEFVIND